MKASELENFLSGVGKIQPISFCVEKAAGITETHPFILVQSGEQKFEVVWLQLVELAEGIQMDEIAKRMILHSIAFGKMRSEHQTLAQWRNMELFTLPHGQLFRNVNTIGLREWIASGGLPEDADGSIVIYWHAFNAHLAVYGVWSTSEKAAREFVMRAHQGMRSEYESCGLNYEQITRELFTLTNERQVCQ